MGKCNGATLASDGSWQPSTGSDWTSGSGFTQWGYSASGGYGYALVGGAVSGTWAQSGNDSTTYNTDTSYTQSGSDNPVYTGSQANGETAGQHSSYSGSGSYGVGDGWTGWYSGTTAAIALAGAGMVLESGSDDWGYGYATQAQMSGDGAWLPATGSGSTTETNAAHWSYAASGTYNRPSDAGMLQGTWQASGGSDSGYVVQSPFTLNPDGSWTTTGVASSSGSGFGHWGYAGSASSSSSSGYGDASNGGDSSASAQISESYAQGWSSQYAVLSTLAADGAVTAITTASASGSASGSHSYASSGASENWHETGDYAGGNGTSSQTENTSALALTETVQSQWQEGYTSSSLPGQATTSVGGSSGSSTAAGDSTFSNGYSSETASDSSGSGYAYDSDYGNTDSSGGADHYLDQTVWSQGYAADGSSSSASTSSNQVWGDIASQWGDSNWYSSQGSGSSWSGGSSSGGSSSGSYDQTTYSPGFGGETGAHDGAWAWGQNGYGTAHGGPLGPSAFWGVGYVFTPTDPVSVADVADQSNTEGDAVSLQVQASDWSSGATSASGMGSGSGSGWNPYSISGLPAGLGISSTGLISGIIQPGDAANGPYFVTATYTDGAGNTASQSFEWDVADPVTIADPGDQSGAEGDAVWLSMQVSDSIAGAAPLTYSASDLPGGLSISATTGLISGTLQAGDAAAGDDGLVRLLDVSPAPGLEVRYNLVHGSPVDSIAFSPDGKFLATTTFNGKVAVWTLGEKAEPHVLFRGDKSQYAAAWSPDGKFLAVGDEEGRIRVFDAASGEEKFQLRGQDGAVFDLAFSLSGDLLAAVGPGTGGRSSSGTSIPSRDTEAPGVKPSKHAGDGRRDGAIGRNPQP